MSTPRIPPLRIIESEPVVTPTSPSPIQVYPETNQALGYTLLLGAFLLLTTGMICSPFILPMIHIPLLAISAALLSIPVIIFSVIKLA
ncbi:hypothetical protein HQ393_13225 [Chitinibacter bivalviorum]|uniref:Uncharacterized protein n=1 Tax=Chitinibacter bivalviorum TaxID=2739434 RepID=A0A7H9BL98_9NEIS|nr:hypothetical protein [Chitinibacter bivalviorum]QLG89126.1 hypothetical protein HQ393_13225 [Chitinibacter bivalviorum]